MHKILLAETSKHHLQAILASPQAKHYQIEKVFSGPDLLKKLESFDADLLLIDQMLPEMHGIELLRYLRSNFSRKRGIIICCSFAMIQNYRAAMREGADYFLEKPYTPDLFFQLVERYFAGSLQPEPFSRSSAEALGEHCYLPRYHAPDCYLKFWGTRGSNPVAGPGYVRYGGNTACLEIRHHNDLVIIDAGSGIRPLGQLLAQEKIKTIHLLIGHTHWDHIVGLPFFEPLYDPDCEIHLYSPVGFEKEAKMLFTEMLAYAFFPVRLDEIQAKLHFHALRSHVPLVFGEIAITPHYAYHPGATLCFKIRAGNKTIGYATDNEFLMGYHGNPLDVDLDHPLLEPQLGLVEFFQGCDLIIHEAQYTPLEYTRKIGWGHSSITNATILVRHTAARQWIVTHHDPSHTDDILETLLQIHHDVLDDCQTFCQVRHAFDGLTLPL